MTGTLGVPTEIDAALLPVAEDTGLGTWIRPLWSVQFLNALREFASKFVHDVRRGTPFGDFPILSSRKYLIRAFREKHKSAKVNRNENQGGTAVTRMRV